ncbi:hypothetical protein NDU88_004349 [Pleurodeles waltl]|uniref:Uncharacterized protein n=1 Tax=Pleurodeles waltl TaxID=8319 RepID=A0AAV7W4R1_PLEWA|nr:hypothetical protein NDU88_004349 [Pleurodeles waltl]
MAKSRVGPEPFYLHLKDQGARWCRRSGEARKPRPPEPSTKPLLHPPSLRNAVLQQRGFPLSEEPSRCRLDKGLPLLPRRRTSGRGGSWLFGLLGDRRDAIRRGQHSALSRLNRVQKWGAKTTRIGKDKGEAAGANKRRTSITGKAAGNNVSGSLRDAKTGNSNTPPSETRPIGKNQSTITAFLACGVQDSLPAHITPSLESKVLGVETPLPCAGIETEDSNKEISEKIPGLSGLRQSQIQQSDQNEESELQNKEGAIKASGPALEKDDLTIPLGNGKKWDKVVGKEPQLMDWGKDCSDKFYSLTEESDLSNVDRSFSESVGSETSEAGNKSPSNELTVRQYRQRKMVRICPGSQEGVENAASMSGRTLKWDYSGIGLIGIPTSGSQGLVNEKTDIGASAGGPGNAFTMGTEAGILQSIYNSIKELQTETRIESRRARIATKRLQGTVRKVAKSCTEIEAKLCSMEERIVAVEEDIRGSARDRLNYMQLCFFVEKRYPHDIVEG